MLPYEAWGAGDSFGPPPGDAAVAALQALRPAWAAQLAELRGWPAKPAALIPLSGPAATVDPAHIYVYGAEVVGGPLVHVPEAVVETRLLSDGEGEGTTLEVTLRDPAPPGLAEVGFLVFSEALGGPDPLMACDPERDSREVIRGLIERVGADAWPEETAFAFPTFPLARTSDALVRTWEREAATPSLQVAEVEARTQADFGEAASPPDVAAALNPTIAWARLTLPDYRDGETKHAALDGQGALAPAGTTQPGVLVLLPTGGTPPYPWVLFQHGGNQDKSDVLQIAGPLAQAGFALVALDLPYHGDRALAAGGSDLDILDFDDPLKTRDAFRQAAADQMAVAAGVGALNAALAPVFGTGEALDGARAYYMGLSLGAVSGSLSFSAGHGYGAAALFVGGGYYPTLLGGGVFSLFVQDIHQAPPVEATASLLFMEALLDGADPVSYALRAEDRQAPPRPVLFFQAKGDPLIAQEASDGWARAFGADVAQPMSDPVDHEVAGMALVPLPAQDNFVWPADDGGAVDDATSEVGPGATRLLLECPMAGVAVSDRHAGLITAGYSQELVAHCFAGVASDGSCEVVDTGFAAPE